MVEEWKENLDNSFIVGAVLTDLSKAFDCIPHDLPHDRKASVYDLNSDSLLYIYSYLKDRKQCVQINNQKSEFDTIIQVYAKAQFLDQFYLIFCSTIFYFLLQRHQFIILRMIIL